MGSVLFATSVLIFLYVVVIDNHLILFFFPVLMILGPAGTSFFLVLCSLKNPCSFQEAGMVQTFSDRLSMELEILLQNSFPFPVPLLT